MSWLEKLYYHLAYPPSYCLCHFSAAVDLIRKKLADMLEAIIYGKA